MKPTELFLISLVIFVGTVVLLGFLFPAYRALSVVIGLLLGFIYHETHD